MSKQTQKRLRCLPRHCRTRLEHLRPMRSLPPTHFSSGVAFTPGGGSDCILLKSRSSRLRAEVDMAALCHTVCGDRRQHTKCANLGLRTPPERLATEGV
jgi:hypothetical protein